MKIAVIGGTGLIGSQVVSILNASGHEAVPHSPESGVDLLTGRGLPEALNGTAVVVNLTNSPAFDDSSLLFFQTTMDNLIPAANAAGVRHIIILSIVGADETTVRLPGILIQPMASADVAQAVADVSVDPPLRGTREIAGPDVFALDELGRITLAAHGDHRAVVTDNNAGMFGPASGDALIAKDGTVIAKTSYREWLAS